MASMRRGERREPATNVMMPISTPIKLRQHDDHCQPPICKQRAKDDDARKIAFGNGHSAACAGCCATPQNQTEKNR